MTERPATGAEVGALQVGPQVVEFADQADPVLRHTLLYVGTCREGAADPETVWKVRP